MTPAPHRAAAAPILLLLFLLVAVLVSSRATQGLDDAVLAGLRQPLLPGSPRGPHWLFVLAAHVTVLGALPVRAALGGAASLVLWSDRRRRGALVLLLASPIEAALIEGVKRLFDRARPDLAYHLVSAGHASFPSGHATGSMLLYPLAGLLIGALGGRRGGRIGASIGIALALGIGITRIMLGVHWTSDVVAGWLLGGSFAFMGAALASAKTAR